MSERERLLEIVAPLIGKPWASRAVGPEAYDCWGLAAHLQGALMGRDLPLAPSLQTDAADPRAVIEAIRSHPLQRLWVPVGRPRHGDVVLMRRRRDPAHVGVWIDGGPDLRGVIHAAEGGGVMLQDLGQIRALWPGVEFRRPVEASLEAVAAAEAQARAALEGAEALAVIVRDPVNPLFEAGFLPLKAGLSPAEALGMVAEAERPEGVWMVLGSEPLLRRHPETGADEWVERRLQPGEILWLCPEPPAGDEGGSSILGAIAMIAVAVAAPWAVGAIGSIGGIATVNVATGALTFFGQALVAGITLGASMLIGALTRPSTALDQGPSAPSPTYSATPPGNRVNPGGQIARLYGTVRRQPDLLARPWGQFADNEHEMAFLLCVGLGKHRINGVYIEDTPVWLAESGYTGAYPSAEVQILQPGEQVTLFPARVAAAPEIGGQTLAPPVGPEPPEDPETPPAPPVEQIVGPFVIVPADLEADRLAFDLAFSQGLFKLDGKGREASASVSFRIEAQEVDAAGAPLGPWIALIEETLAMATTTPQRLTREVAVSLGRHQVRFRRTSASEIGEGDQGRDELVLAGARAFIPGDQRYPDVTALAVRIRADETTSQANQQWVVDATAILPYWDAASETWIEGPTERIEAALLDVMKAPYGLGLPEARVDLSALEALAEIWAARGDLCCLAVDQAQSCWEVAEAMGRCGRAAPQVVGGIVTFTRDQSSLPRQAIGPNDMIRGSLKVTRQHRTSEGPTVVRARYWDRQTRMRDVLCVPPGVTAPREAVVNFPGIVDHAQVWREGIYMAAANLRRRTWLAFSMLAQGRALRRGDLIRVAHPRPAYGRGALIAAAVWPHLVLSAPHGIGPEDERQQWLSLTRPDGSAWGPVRVSAVEGDPWALLVDQEDFGRILAAPAPSAYSPDPRDWLISEETLSAPEGRSGGALLAGRQAEPTRALWGPDAGGPVLCVVQSMTPRADGTVEVVAAVEAAAVHAADQGEAPAEPAASNLSPLATAPLWSGAAATLEEAPDGRQQVVVSGPSIPGAVRYELELSVDHGATWTRAASAEAPRLAAPAPAAPVLLVRAAAVGRLRGPWASWTLDAQHPLWALRAPEGLRTLEAPEPEYRWVWDAVPGATGYDVEVLTGGLLRRTSDVTAPLYVYTAALQRPDGGPWRAATLRVRARRGTERGPWASLASDNSVPPPPAALALASAAATSLTLSWTLSWTPSADPTVTGYRLIAGDPAAPLASLDVSGRAVASATLTGLTASTSYALRIAALDDAPEGLAWSAPLTASTTGA